MLVKILDSCPWPERRGLIGRILTPPREDRMVYPWAGRGKNEVIILIEDDPLNGPGTRYNQVDWTCALDRKDVEEI